MVLSVLGALKRSKRRLPRILAWATAEAPIGGQAVLEGVMMRGVSTWSVAVRTPSESQLAEAKGRELSEAANGPVELLTQPLVTWTTRRRVLRLPIVRGVVALVQSLAIGFKALDWSASKATGAEEQSAGGGARFAATVAIATAFAIGLFFILPAGIVSTVKQALPGSLVFVVVEKLVRVAILVAYLWLISRIGGLRRVFEYHGAEHKAIACYEAQATLEPESAQRFSRFHPRCGTSFLLIVMIVAVVVFAPLGTPPWYWLFASRVIGVPLVAGLAFEVLRLFARHRTRWWARMLMAPGLQLQRLTTREPDLGQLAVAIAALKAVLEAEDPSRASAQQRIGMEVVA